MTLPVGIKVKITKDLLDSDENCVLAKSGDLGTIISYFEGFPTVELESKIQVSVDFDEFEKLNAN